MTLLLLVTAVYGADYRYYGPDSGSLIVIAYSDSRDDEAVSSMSSLRAFYEANPPKVRTLVTTLPRASLSLPEGYRPAEPPGIEELSSVLELEDSVSIFLILPGDEDTILVRNGVKGGTPPRWLVSAVRDSLMAQNRAWNFEETRLPLFRLGWREEDPAQGALHRRGFPVIALGGSLLSADLIANVASDVSSSTREGRDKHYLIEDIGERTVFISEGFLVSAMIAVFAAILAFVFIFSFLFGKKSEQRLLDLFRVWWLPFVYLALTTLALHLAGSLTSLLVQARFGSSSFWELVPRAAFACKLLLAWFIVTIVVSMNQVIKLPEDGFIYGYMAGISAMINIIVFSGVDFSLSLVFLSVYVVTFVVYRLQSIPAQLLGMALMAVPLIPYLEPLAFGNVLALKPLWQGGDNWNTLMAFFIMPFQMMSARLHHTLGRYGRRRKAYLPITAIASLFLSIAGLCALFIIPAWSLDRPLAVVVRHVIDENGERFETDAPRGLGTLTYSSRISSPTSARGASEILSFTSESRRFLEKALVSVTVDVAIPADLVEVRILTTGALAVHTASIPFVIEGAGSRAAFTFNDLSKLPFTFTFSTDSSASLAAEVRVLSGANPWDIACDSPYVKTSYVLEARRLYPVPLGDGR